MNKLKIYRSHDITHPTLKMGSIFARSFGEGGGGSSRSHQTRFTKKERDTLPNQRIILEESQSIPKARGRNGGRKFISTVMKQLQFF